MTQLLPVKSKIESEKLIKVSPFKSEIRTTSPHRHNSYFELIYLSAGSGYHYIDLHRYEVTPPVLYCIRKEQLHYWDLLTEGKGFVIILKKAFLDQSTDPSLQWLFNRLSTGSCYQLGNASFADELFHLLLGTYEAETANQELILEGLIKALLARVAANAKPLPGRPALSSGIYGSFVELLASNGNVKQTVKFYADRLHTTPQNLNAACRKAAGQSATSILTDFIMSEAKRLLLYTSNTISEISFGLGFSDSSHFVKFFKKAVGATPQNFRLSHH